ncbi:MAG TPA: alpha/beta fold hydrolase [Acidimicrobiia bacterium]
MNDVRVGSWGRRAWWVAVLALVVCVVAAIPPVRAAAGGGDAPLRPIVFVHGFFGSGAQFETQAKRFTSNGYPAEAIAVLDYDSGFGIETEEDVFARLDELVAGLLAETGADRVDLLGHSLGTRLMQTYLRSSPERAARVAHYVNLDGAPSDDPPGGVTTLAVWGQGNDDQQIGGAENAHFPDQTHTQVVTSPETFEEIYTFFTGEEPETTKLAPERNVELAGRAIIFPENSGVADGELEIYEVDAETGERVRERPDATFPLEGDGSWGPFEARGKKRYEFAIVRPDASTHHLYYEPFIRSDSWVRLLTSPVEGGINALLNPTDENSGMAVIRYKEWWGDQEGANDVLEIDGENVITPEIAPLEKRAIAIFAFDEENDGQTDLSGPMARFDGLPFLAGADIFVPSSGSAEPDDTISVVSTPRGGGGRVVTMSVPNWTSSMDRISIQFSDHVQGARRARS